MDDEAMLKVLEEHHRVIRAGLVKIRRHCSGRSTSVALDVDRLELTRVSRARSTFVSDVLVPSLLKDVDVQRRSELMEMLSLFVAKRQISDAHIAMWTPTSIEQDWDGYCEAAQKIWPMMEDQMELERGLFSDLLGNR